MVVAMGKVDEYFATRLTIQNKSKGQWIVRQTCKNCLTISCLSSNSSLVSGSPPLSGLWPAPPVPRWDIPAACADSVDRGVQLSQCNRYLSALSCLCRSQYTLLSHSHIQLSEVIRPLLVVPRHTQPARMAFLSGRDK